MGCILFPTLTHYQYNEYKGLMDLSCTPMDQVNDTVFVHSVVTLLIYLLYSTSMPILLLDC